MPAPNQTDHDARALPELGRLLVALDELGGEVDAELMDDRLTFEFADGAEGLINSHRAARQIWLAWERTAWHFAWDGVAGRWLGTKTGEELWSVLERILSAKLGRTVRLQRPG